MLLLVGNYDMKNEKLFARCPQGNHPTATDLVSGEKMPDQRWEVGIVRSQGWISTDLWVINCTIRPETAKLKGKEFL